MAGEGYSLEGFKIRLDHAQEFNGAKTAEEVEAYIRADLNKQIESSEQIRTVFANLFPGLDVTCSQDDTRERRIAHATAQNTYIHLVSEYSNIKHASNSETNYRHMSAVYKPERTQEDIDYNNHLRECMETNNYAELGKLYDEHIRNLPTFDPDVLQTIPDADLPLVFRELYPLYIATQEAVAFLADTHESAVGMKANMSEESMQRLEEITKHMTALSDLKLRCDKMASPYYPYIDPSVISPTKQNIDATDMMEKTPQGASHDLMKFITSIHNGLSYKQLDFPDDVKHMLEGANIDPAQTVLRDFSGKQYTLSNNPDGCAEVFKREEPLFCTFGNQLKAFKMEGSSIVEVKPKDALEYCLHKVLPAALENADNSLNNDIADPRWMLTRSSEYRGMQKALANYRKVVNGKPGLVEQTDEKAMNALEALRTSAQAYFNRKNVDLGQYPDFNDFYNKADMAQTMSHRELARMKAAYDVMAVYNGVSGIMKMQQELSAMPSYDKDIPVKPTYSQKAKQSNDIISKSAFLNAPVDAVDGNNTGDLLREELKKALLDPGKGLLNKKFFTAQDRQAADDVLAKAVILSMIRSGRKVATPSAIEQQKPKDAIDMIKGSEAFQKAKDKFLTPDGLRRFLTEHREATVNRDIQGKSKENNEMQKQNQPKVDTNLQIQQGQVQQQQPQQELPKPQTYIV